MYPVMLHLEGRSCVIIGGGRVAARKAVGLLEAGAQVTIISPAVSPELQSRIDAGEITLIASNYRPGILSDLRPMLVFTATNDPAVNQQAAEEGRACGALVNRADSGAEGDLENMVSFRRGRLAAAVSTGGASPALARHLIERLQLSIGDEYVTLADWMAESRMKVRAAIPTQPERAALWQAVVSSPVLDELRQGNTESARRLFDDIVAQAIGGAW